jgi:type I restriction enzyme S subunit
VNEPADDKLPSGWTKAPLLELAATITKGSTPTTYGHDYKQDGISFVRVENLANGQIDTESLTAFIDETAHAALRRSQLQAGDILYSIAGTIGRTAIVVEKDLPANTNQALAIIRGTATALLPQFLIHFLSSASSQQRTLLKARGGAMNNISLSDIEKIIVPIAPRPEQKRVVQEIEKQLTRLDAAFAALKRVKANLKRYRASVLKAACEGRLVPTEAELARRERRPYEPASALLERILAERRARWKAEQKSNYKEPPRPPTDTLPSLPEGWTWASWEQLSPRVTVGHVGPMKDEYVPEGFPFLRSQNVRENKFDREGLLHIPEEFHRRLSKSLICAGDLVVVRSGSVGTTCVVPDHLREANCADLVIIKQPLQTSSWYGCYYMNSAARRYVHAGKVGVALIHFNTKSVAQLPVALPPREEQDRIVAETQRRLSVVDEIEMQAQADLKRAEGLRQSILRNAFEGKLVPQDPNDEPATILLERIRGTATLSGTAIPGCAPPLKNKPRRKLAHGKSPIQVLSS